MQITWMRKKEKITREEKNRNIKHLQNNKVKRDVGAGNFYKWIAIYRFLLFFHNDWIVTLSTAKTYKKNNIPITESQKSNRNMWVRVYVLTTRIVCFICIICF